MSIFFYRHNHPGVQRQVLRQIEEDSSRKPQRPAGELRSSALMLQSFFVLSPLHFSLVDHVFKISLCCGSSEIFFSRFAVFNLSTNSFISRVFNAYPSLQNSQYCMQIIGGIVPFGSSAAPRTRLVRARQSVFAKIKCLSLMLEEVTGIFKL